MAALIKTLVTALVTVAAGLCFLAVPLASAQAASTKPTVVSLDFCTDQFVLALAEPEQILALSSDAARDFSFMREAALPYRRIRPNTEEILSLQPDLVIRSWAGNADHLARIGLTVTTIPYAANFDGAAQAIRVASEALQQEARGQQIIDNLESRLAELAESRPANANNRPSALYITPGEVTAGKGTFVHEILTAAGVENLAVREGKVGWSALPLEALLYQQPDLMIAAFFNTQTEQANHWSLRRHRAAGQVLNRATTIELPPDLLGCSAWYAVNAAEMVGQHVGK